MPEVGLEDSRRQLFGIFICFVQRNLFGGRRNPYADAPPSRGSNS